MSDDHDDLTPDKHPLDPFPGARSDMPPTIHDPAETADPGVPVQPEYVVTYAAGERPPPLTDPDHFAVSEEDYDTDNVLDRFYRWIADRVGVGNAAEDVDDQVLAERTRRWTSRTIAFAALTLLFLNAESIRSWSSTLEPSWATETLRLVAGEWADRLKTVGLDQPRQSIHDAYESQKTKTWGGDAKPAPPPPS
jgi:hypothetical protein